MKQLKVDISEIINAMECSFDGENHYYIDVETGKILLIPDEILSAVENDEKEVIDDFPEWMKAFLKDASAVISDTDDRFLPIPILESWESFKYMQEFVETVKDQFLKEKLEIALDGKGAFGRFKNVLAHYPLQREAWFELKNKKMKKEALDWLASVGIAPL